MFQSENLRHIRDQKDITREQVCTAIGVDEDTYFAWENGDAEPRKEQQEALADFFGVSVNSLHHRTAVFGNSDAYDTEKSKQQRQEEQLLQDGVYCARTKRVLIVLTVVEAVFVVISLFSDPLAAIVSAVLTGFFLIKLWLGKNWARILFSVFAAFSFLGNLADISSAAFSKTETPFSGVTVVIALVGLLYNGFLFCFLCFSESMKTYVRVNEGK